MALSPTALATGFIQRVLPPAQSDSRTVDSPARMDRYGGPAITYAAHSLNGLADSGAIVVASNIAVGTPAAGTGVTWVAAQTSFSDTQPNFIIYNPNQAGGASIHLLCLKMVANAVGTAAVSWQYAGVLDPVGNRSVTTNHVSQASVAPVRAGLGGPANAPILPLVLYQSSATASAISASSQQARLVSRGSLGALNVIGDEFVINFGSFEGGGTSTLTAAEAAGIGTRRSAEGPVVIDPGTAYTLTIWGPSSSAAIAPDFQFWMALL